MPVIIATREEVQEYFQTDALSQSKLKKLLGDLNSFHKEEDSSADHFVIGSAVDCILTNSREAFEAEYYISEIDKLPSDSIITILKLVYEDLLQDYAEQLEVITGQEQPLPVMPFIDFVGDLKNHSTYILDACEKTEWQSRWGTDAKLKNIIEPGIEYFMDLCKAFGKKVISKSQASLIDAIVTSLQTNPRTSKYFDRTTFESLSDITIYYQFPIYFEYKGIQCKALLDMVIVERDIENKILSITGIDLKTMNGNTYYFPYSIKQRRYDIQAAWYTLALHQHFAVPTTSTVIKPFQFVVESTTFQGKPLVYNITNDLLKIGRFGRRAISLFDTGDMFKGYDSLGGTVVLPEIKGFEQLLDLYVFHTENGFNEEIEIQKAGLTPLVVSWDGIV